LSLSFVISSFPHCFRWRTRPINTCNPLLLVRFPVLSRLAAKRDGNQWLRQTPIRFSWRPRFIGVWWAVRRVYAPVRPCIPRERVVVADYGRSYKRGNVMRFARTAMGSIRAYGVFLSFAFCLRRRPFFNLLMVVAVDEEKTLESRDRPSKLANTRRDSRIDWIVPYTYGNFRYSCLGWCCLGEMNAFEIKEESVITRII